MPRQNRVTPDGCIRALPERGDFMGNRGCLHDASGHLGTARWRGRRWITCVLNFNNRPPRRLMAPGRYTELFFLDEAVALAAGHRPCAECRREAYRAYCSAWEQALGPAGGADSMDDALHAARLVDGTKNQKTFLSDISDLPDGVFVKSTPESDPHLLWNGKIWRCVTGGYAAAGPRPASGEVTVLTPRPSVEILRAGYLPQVHRTARAR